MYASILRTDPAQVAELGEFFMDRGNFTGGSLSAVRRHCIDWAAKEGVIAPKIIITDTYDAPLDLGKVQDVDGGELTRMRLSFTL